MSCPAFNACVLSCDSQFPKNGPANPIIPGASSTGAAPALAPVAPAPALANTIRGVIGKQ